MAGGLPCGLPRQPAQIWELIRGDVFFWQSLQAAAILVAVPIAYVFLDRFISRFTMGAVKG
jgi:multiple sugar transport system permease protein